MEKLNHEISAAEEVSRIAHGIVEQTGKIIYGQQHPSLMLAGAFLIGGHVLIEGPPGIAKTLLAKSFAGALGLNCNRIQFTPDLMPSDITGVNIFDQQSSQFRFAPGPLFADIVLADEINRTPPKTQAALLEAMEERFVTIDGKRHHLSNLFFVIATQNPIEHEGTFPLPEAQLDRFLFKIKMGYPEREQEEGMIMRFSSESPQDLSAHRSQERGSGAIMASPEELNRARCLLRTIKLDTSLAGYIMSIVAKTRAHPDLILGASPRAALNLALAAKYQAALDGRNYAIPDDIKSMAPLVLSHRLISQPELYNDGERLWKLIAEVIDQVPIPSCVQV